LDFGIARKLSGVGLSETDHPNAVFGLGKTQDMQSIIQHAHRHIAHLTVGLPVVAGDKCRSEVEFGRPIKGKPTLMQVALVLGGIEGDAYFSDCMNK
jgi:hypothetical protein